MKSFTKQWAVRPGIWSLATSLAIGLLVIISSTRADDPPVLTIAPSGTNQFLISITNASSAQTYELYRTPVLGSEIYPWTLSVTGALGQSNFTVVMGAEQTGFWRASVGTDWDGDGIPNWMDADPNNTGAGALTVTIDSPTNGFNFN
jgi:hypothetical protein